jgi:hypothetical protein
MISRSLFYAQINKENVFLTLITAEFGQQPVKIQLRPFGYITDLM